MPDLRKPVDTIALAASVVSLVKTAAVVFVMMALEWARLRERRSALEAAKAENDLAVEKLKGADDAPTDPADAVDRYLARRGLPRKPRGG